MVADQADLAALPDERRALVRLRAVADHVAQAPDPVDPRSVCFGEHRLEGGQVGVDVTDQREAQFRTPGTRPTIVGGDEAGGLLAALDRGARGLRGGGDGDRRRGGGLGLAPSDPDSEPVTVSERDYFSAAELDRAREYRAPQRLLLIVSLAIEAAVLTAVALGRPAPLRRRLERLAERPLRGAALAGAAVSLSVTLATLPVSLISHERAVDVGLSTQSLDSWLWDVARSAGITARADRGGRARCCIALVRRFPRRWWIPGAALPTGLAVVFVWIAPVVLAPIFNSFEPLPEGSRARADVLELGERAGVEIGEVYRVDASRRVHVAERVRRRDRLDASGWCCTTTCSRTRGAPGAALRGRPRARPRRRRRHPPRARLRRDRRPARAAVHPRARAGDRAPPRRRPGEPGGGARLPARADAGRARARRARQPALAPGRGARRPFALELTHDPQALIDAPASSWRGRTSPTRIRRAGTRPCSAPTRRRCERIGAALAYEGR